MVLKEQAATSSVVARTNQQFPEHDLFPSKRRLQRGGTPLRTAPARAFGGKRHNPARVPAACRMCRVRPVFAPSLQAASLYSSATLSRRMRFFSSGAEMRRSARRSRPGCRGQVESLCGKSLAHMSWCGSSWSANWKAVQSSWKVSAMCSRKYSDGRRCELLALHPVAVALVGVVHAVHEMRRPAGIGFDADDAQLGMALEHAANRPACP